MKSFRFAGALGAVALVASSVAFAMGAQSRGEVSSSILGACGGDEAACISAVNQQLAAANKLGCSTEALGVARGLADATSAINLKDPVLATKMAEAVALNGKQCLQVAYGAVVDGTGTAAVPETPPVAGSEG